MPKFITIGFELAAIALIAGSMLTGQPLWTQAAAAPASTITLAQTH